MPDKKQERKVILILDQKSAIYLGYRSQMSMLPITTVKYKNIYIKQTKPHGYYPSNTICRETTIAYIIEQLSKSPQKRVINILVIIPKKQRNNLDKGIKLINHYEKLLNWNKTYICDVDEISGIGKAKGIYGRYIGFSFVLVTIPNKWLYSPQLLSLYLMFLKITETGFECEFKTHEELMSQLDIFFARKPTNLSGFKFGFHYQTQATYKYWDIFLHNLDVLYKNKTRKFNYNMDNHLEKLYNNDSTYDMHLDGISSLVKNISYDKQLRKNFGVLKKTIKMGK